MTSSGCFSAPPRLRGEAFLLLARSRAHHVVERVVGACTALHTLAVDGVRVLPLTLGHGTATGSHGIFPIPAPATAAILKGMGLVVTPGDHDGELCTPTGAALLAEFSTLDHGMGGGYTIQATGDQIGGSRNRSRPPREKADLRAAEDSAEEYPTFSFPKYGRTLFFAEGNRINSIGVGGAPTGAAGGAASGAPTTGAGGGRQRINFTVRVEVDNREERKQVFNEACELRRGVAQRDRPPPQCSRRTSL